MRTAYRVLSTVVAAGAIFPVWLTPAQAATSTPVKVETAAWFWAEQTSGSVPVVGLPQQPIPADTASGVPAGDLAVAYAGKTETRTDGTKQSIPDKETYLAWDVYSVPEGATVDQFTFTIFVDTTAKNVVPPEVAVPGQPTRGGQPPIVACAAKIGFGEGYGDAFTAKPEDDCTDQVFGEYDALKSSYTFDATTYAQDWVDGKDNFGLGIRPLEDEDDPFQLALLPASKVVATLAWTAPEPEPIAPPVDPGVVAPPAPPVDTSVFVPAGPQPQPQPQPQAPPVVAVTRPAVPVQNVAANPLRSTRGLGGTFWWAMAGGVLLLGLASLILGDPLEAVPVTRRTAVRAGRHRATVPATPSLRPRTV